MNGNNFSIFSVLLNNTFKLALSGISQVLGRGKYFRKRLFSSKRILEKNFPMASDFAFLQVGANDGKSFDFLYDFVVNRNSKGIVIEPIREYFEELYETYRLYPEILKINKAVNIKTGSVSLYKIDSNFRHLYTDWVKGIASFNLDHLTKFDFIRKEHILEEKVMGEPLMDIIENCKIAYFDYFQVDTEGYDYEVLAMFDFSVYKPKMIRAEYINLTPPEKKGMITILKKNGYYIFFQGLDIIGIDLKRIKL